MTAGWPWGRPGRPRSAKAAYNEVNPHPAAMCLAVPGRILSIASSAPVDSADADLWRVAEVDFGGVRQRRRASKGRVAEMVG